MGPAGGGVVSWLRLGSLAVLGKVTAHTLDLHPHPRRLGGSFRHANDRCGDGAYERRKGADKKHELFNCETRQERNLSKS